MSKAREGDWGPAQQFVVDRKFLFLSILVPSAIFLRFPFLITSFGRWLIVGGIAIGEFLMKNPQLRNMILQYLYKAWINAARNPRKGGGSGGPKGGGGGSGGGKGQP